MFPKIATTGVLLHAGSKPDVGFAVREWPSPGYAHKKGDAWTFWIGDDPRNEDGNFKYIAKYVCIESGNDDAKWEKQE